MIEVTRNDRVVHLLIDAPPVNVMDTGVMAELTEQVRRCGEESELAAVLIEGKGKCFSAGASVAEHRPPAHESMVGGLLDACVALADAPLPVVALVHGACLGGAMELISFCDFVVADPKSKLGQPEIKLAFFPPVAVYQLPRLTGLQNAAWAVLTGETLSAERAQAMGLVQQVLPKDEWGKLDETFNGLSAPVLRMAKRALREATGGYRRDSLDKIKRLFVEELYRIEDVQEGIASFEERRAPSWKQR